MRPVACLIAAIVLAVPVTAKPAVRPAEAVDRVWSGHSVPFAIGTTRTHIYVGYYDANRQLTLAFRPLNNPAHWVYHRLDTWLGWDSHNAIAMAFDRSGALHVAANMHVDPLTYFRSDASGDVRTLKRVAVMTDPAKEAHMTYPVFLNDAEGRLVFKYRDGTSGRGNEVYNIYDETAGWKALASVALVDGEGQRNAYFAGPVMGPDGWFHLAWVWRDSPMAETNHDLSYARSRNLVNWERSDGRPLSLPIRLNAAEVVDPVPVRGGIINNNTVIGFDDQGRVAITYHKYDSAGDTQIWLARREGDRWHMRQISQWKGYRWDFKGGGSLDSEIFVGGARPGQAGRLIIPVVRLGKSLEFIVDAQTLELIEERSVASTAETAAGRMSVPGGMVVNTVQTQGHDGKVFTLAWPTRPPNRDLPAADIPPPTDLLLFQDIAKGFR